jgi:hypothetical protein
MYSMPLAMVYVVWPLKHDFLLSMTPRNLQEHWGNLVIVDNDTGSGIWCGLSFCD